MEIRLSKKQFKSLLELVYLGNWVVNSKKTPDVIDKEYENVANLIYSYGKEAGLEKYVSYSEMAQCCTPTTYLFEESDASKILKKYDEDTYWSNLVERFALKEFHNKYSAEKIKKMSSPDRMEKILTLIRKYEVATYDHSIDPFEMLKEIPVGR